MAHQILEFIDEVQKKKIIVEAVPKASTYRLGLPPLSHTLKQTVIVPAIENKETFQR